MTIIKKIINWLKALFRKLFKRNDKKQAKKKINKLDSKNKKKLTNKNYVLNEDMPSYMVLSNSEKEKLLYSLVLMKNLLNDNHTKNREKEVNEIVNILKSNNKVSFSDLDNDKLLNSRYLELLVKELDNEEKKDIVSKQQAIIKEDNDFKIHLDEVEKVIELIKKNDISIISESEINKETDIIINDKNISDKTNEKIDNFCKNIRSIISNIDEDFLCDVVREYNKINYVTVFTLIIDKNYERFKKLEESIKNHQYNKYYYEREINRIKHELNQIKNIKTRKDVSDHINNLKKELYTKSKDKYDLLYNNEVFMNFEKECDNLLDKLNTKVVDIKKEKEVEPNKNQYLENILLRFQDMELARKIILLAQEDDEKLSSEQSIVDYVNMIYDRYSTGLNFNFNFERNKEKTELVVLYNSINKAISKIEDEPFITVDHINFRMDDLLEASKVKKEELNMILKKHHIEGYEDEIVDDKIDDLDQKNGNKKKNKHVLVKANDKRNN